MKTEVNLESLEGMSFADYKKALKKDKKFLKKANGVMFVNDHKFSDGKKGLAMMIFKKPKEVKQCFKDLKKKGHPSPKMAGGSCELTQGENGPELKVELKLGGLKEDKIMAKGKSYFNSVLGLSPSIVKPDPSLNDGQINEDEKDSLEDLKSELRDLQKQGAAVKTAIENFKAGKATQENAEAIEEFVEDVKEWLIDYKNDSADVKAALKEYALKLKAQYDKLAPVQPKIKEQADKNDPKGFFGKLGEKAGDLLDKVKDKVEGVLGDQWEDDDISDIGEEPAAEDSNDEEETPTETPVEDNSTTEEPASNDLLTDDSPELPSSISAAVGDGATNQESDVKLVQTLLNKQGASLVVDGDCGNKTIAAIKKFQQEKVGFRNPDGVVDPGGKTWNALSSGASTTTEPTDDNSNTGTDDNNQEPEPIDFQGSTWDPKYTDARIKKLDGRVQGPAFKFVNDAFAQGFKIRVTSTLRTVQEQDALYAKGGVTQARGGQSYHNYGLAIDIVEIKDGKALWNNPNWGTIAAIGKACGFEWGGDWSGFVDKPHFQMPFGKTTKELMAAKYPARYKEIYGVDAPVQDETSDNPQNDNSNNDAPVSSSINKSVGASAANELNDVKLVQTLLNKHGASLVVDGDCGNKTIAAIKKFQQEKVGFQNPDGVVDPGGKTWNALSKGESSSSEPTDDNSNNTGPINKPNWIQIAEREIGVKENTSKTEHNPRVIEYHATTGGFKNDETPWCSSFVNWVMKKAGQGGTNSAAAISWKNWGQKVDQPAYGAIAVIDWDGPGPGWKGHVGFVVGKQGSSILLLGGNQSNAVNIKSFGTSKVVAYVYPSGFEIPQNYFTFGESSGDFGDDVGFDGSR